MSLRVAILLPLALFIIVGLFWLMQWMIAPGEVVRVEREELPGIEIVRVEEEEPPTSRPDASPQSSPPPPPPTPPSLQRPDLPSVSVPVPQAPSVSEVAAPLSFSGSQSLSSGEFGGFAGGTGSGAGDGYGSGSGFKGRELVPLSTARPMMPEWACDQEIEGWVEVIFTVMPNGRVQDVRIIDAEPKGVYETAAIQSVSNWIYQSSNRAREVKQRVEMDPAECAYDYR